ncbi:MAG: hypothetical protein ABSD77_03190 [Verrucomicrobiota bacterium]|jgi:hypothetical protein
MKTCRLLKLAAVVLCGIAVYQARAQSSFFTLYFDENGNGSWSPGSLVISTGPGINADPGQLLPDPSQPGNPLVLTYLLPLVPGDTVFSGDIRIWDPVGIAPVLSDAIRFTNANGNLNGTQEADRMIFYSADSLGSLADRGIPVNLTPNDGGGIYENANGGFEWDPAGAENNVYIGLSDVPEPTSFSLMILGGVAGLKRLFLRKQS